MSIRIEGKNIIVRDIREENISSCIETRKINEASFLNQVESDEKSKEWLRIHRQLENDIILEIDLKTENYFIGTIGFTIQNQFAEVGRLSQYTKAIKQLIHADVPANILHNLFYEACMLVVEYLFVERRVNVVYCNVLRGNYFSNALCQRMGGIPEEKIILLENDKNTRVIHYKIKRSDYFYERCNHK